MWPAVRKLCNNLKLQGNTIYLNNENVDISGKSNDVEKKINLAELLPEGLKLTSGSSDGSVDNS